MKMLSSNPYTQALVNTTLVLLESTKEVWKPVVDISLIILKPFGPLAVLILDAAVRAMVIFGYMTVTTVRKVASYANSTVMLIRESGISVGTAISNAVENLKDVAVSLGTLSKALASLTVRLIKAASFVVNSFDHVSDFLYRSLFQTGTVTWEDIVDVAVPFVVVTCILGFFAWRFSRLFVSPVKPVEFEEPCKPITPRRSLRLARKRAFLSSCEAPLAR